MKSMPSNVTLARFKCNEPRARARSRSAAATVKNAVTLPSNAGQVQEVVTKADVWSSTKNQSTSSAPLNLSGAGLEVEGTPK